MYAIAPQELAALFGVHLDDINAEASAGRLQLIDVNGKMRIVATSLQDLLDGLTISGSNNNGDSDLAGSTKSKATYDQTPAHKWSSTKPFKHRWPDNSVETYDTASTTEIFLNGTHYTLVIGFGWRVSLGMKRRRVTTFLARRTTLHPLVEFVGGNRFEEDGLLAAVIKVNSKHCTHPDDVPPELSALRIGRYRDVIVAPKAAKGMAVIANKEDLDAIAVYALYRAQEKDF